MSERILIYLGPTLAKERALALVPGAIIRPPARQSDVLTDIERYQPTHILLIDGEFHQTLSVWMKELVYAIVRGIKVYGAASMGALRAAELADVGMVGIGRIFEWYRSGVIQDDSEVAVGYGDGYTNTTIPMVNVRTTFHDGDQRELALQIADSFHFLERSDKALRSALTKAGIEVPPVWRDQKAMDALDLLKSFRRLEPKPLIKPDASHLSMLFHAQNERDRKAGDSDICLQHLDAHYVLTSPDYAQTLWDANNRALALKLADIMVVLATPEDALEELKRHCFRYKLSSPEAVLDWCKRNCLSETEFHELLLDNARIRKLHGALNSSKAVRRNTKTALDYLRTWDKFEENLQSTPVVDENDLVIDPKVSGFKVAEEWFSKRPEMRIEGSIEDYISEAGFGTMPELVVAIKREEYGESVHNKLEADQSDSSGQCNDSGDIDGSPIAEPPMQGG